MTVISHDGLFIGSEEYEITNCTDRIRFDPEDHAIKARLYSTANSKGFYCDYEVASGRLRLRSLCTYNSEGDYPPLNGVEARPPKSKYDVAVWEDVGLEMDYTGALVICDCREDNDLLGYYNHMGHQPVFMHKRARCVTFCGGVLVDDFDVSDIVDKVRSMYDAAEDDEYLVRHVDLAPVHVIEHPLGRGKRSFFLPIPYFLVSGMAEEPDADDDVAVKR